MAAASSCHTAVKNYANGPVPGRRSHANVRGSGGARPTSCYSAGGYPGQSSFFDAGMEQDQAALAIQKVVRGHSARMMAPPASDTVKNNFATTLPKPSAHSLDSAIAALTAKNAQDRSRYLIDPRKSKFIGYWDVITGLALVFTAIVTPWEVAFAEPPKSAIESMFLFNRFIDCIFLIDMFLQFFLIYQISTAEGTRWESNPKAIAKHYLFSWFLLDLISILPFDVLSIVAGEALAKLKIVRLFRLMRLIKLIRLIRASRMFKRWETRMAIDYRRARWQLRHEP